MRRWLIESTDQLIEQVPLLLLGGPTGAAKTRILNEGNGGEPIPGSVDLEGLANHRGSAFGRRVTEQPSQISFELAFGVQLLKHQHAGYERLILEDEGRLIGRCALPLSLQAARAVPCSRRCSIPPSDGVRYHTANDYENNQISSSRRRCARATTLRLAESTLQFV